MNPSKFLEIFKNVNAGPMSTLMGLVFFVVGGYMVYATYQGGTGIIWTSFEVILFGAGCGLLLINDEWLKELLSKKDSNEKSE